MKNKDEEVEYANVDMKLEDLNEMFFNIINNLNLERKAILITIAETEEENEEHGDAYTIISGQSDMLKSTAIQIMISAYNEHIMENLNKSTKGGDN